MLFRSLSEHAFVFYHQWFGDMRLVGFIPPHLPPVDLSTRRVQNDMRFDGGIRLAEIFIDGHLTPGGFLRVRTTWQTTAPVERDYTLFVHLLTADGQYVTGFDGPPVNGFRPTSAWVPGEIVVDRKGMFLSADLPRGTYALEVGLYDPATGERLGVSWQGEQDTRVLVRQLYLLDF